MSKIGLVIATEYKTRVMKKSFILLTLLMPLLFAAVIFVPVWLAETGTEMQYIALVDNDGRFSDIWEGSEDYDVEMHVNPEIGDSVQEKCLDGTYSAVVVINQKLKGDSVTDMVSLTIFSEKTMPSSVVRFIENRVGNNITENRLALLADSALLAQIDDAECNVEALTIKCGADGNVEKGAEAEIAVIIGMVATMLIYMFIFISGAQVMNSVIQEKTSRIVEVMLSAIRPWELMWGKLIGVALVCLTQILIWGVVTLTLVVGVGAFIMGDSPEMSSAMTDAMAMQQAGGMTLPSELSMFAGIDWGFIVFWFIAYFIAGYLLYAAVFAAIGAAVDSETDSQQFMLPVTAIVIFALYAGIFSAENPDGALAFWCSIVPFTSPIVMMVRLPFGVAWWELALSFSLLIGSVFAVAWACSKIYRVGILMYGKKASWKELWKWLRYS